MNPKSSVIACLLAALTVLSACSSRSHSSSSSSNPTTDAETSASSVTDTITPEEPPTLSNKEIHAMNTNNPLYTALLEKVNDRETPITWLFIGDSITANDGNSAEEFSNYPEIFQKYLINGLLRPYDTVVNTAVSGWRIANCNYNASVKPYNPDVVFLNIGTNDSFASDTDANAFREKVEAFLDQVKTGGAIPIVIASGSFSDNWGDVNQKNNFLKRYFNAIEGAAKQKETLFVDLFHAYEADRAHASLHYFCSDTVHPSRAGFLFIAQTILRQLGIANEESPILKQDPSVIYDAEPMLERLDITLDLSDYITASSDFKNQSRFFSRGFTMAGGPSAIGKSESFITRRTISQQLMNNLKDGKTVLLPGSLSDIQKALSACDSQKILLLFPEVYAVTGENLIGEGDWIETLTTLLQQAKALDLYPVLVTPPTAPNGPARHYSNDELAEAMRTVADSQAIPLIDLNRYFADLKALRTDYHASLFDKNGILNYAGAAEAAMLIAEAFGQDSSLYSTKSCKELYYPQIWGTQGAGNFFYYYQAKANNKLVELDFIPYDSAFTTKGTFSLSSKNVNLYIGQYVLDVLPQYNVVKGFQAPAGGTAKVTIKMKSHSSDDQLFLVVKNNDKTVAINGKDKTVMTTNHGANKTLTFDVELTENEYLYFIFTAESAQRGYVLINITYD